MLCSCSLDGYRKTPYMFALKFYRGRQKTWFFNHPFLNKLYAIWKKSKLA